MAEPTPPQAATQFIISLALPFGAAMIFAALAFAVPVDPLALEEENQAALLKEAVRFFADEFGHILDRYLGEEAKQAGARPVHRHILDRYLGEEAKA